MKLKMENNSSRYTLKEKVLKEKKEDINENGLEEKEFVNNLEEKLFSQYKRRNRRFYSK